MSLDGGSTFGPVAHLMEGPFDPTRTCSSFASDEVFALADTATRVGGRASVDVVNSDSDDDRPEDGGVPEVQVSTSKRRKVKKQHDVEASLASVTENVWARRAESLGLHSTVLMRMMRVGLPPAIFAIMHYVRRQSHIHEEFDFIELFCGEANLSKGLLDNGWVGLSLDVKKDPVMQNLMNPSGFLALIVWFFKLKTGRALEFYGTVCSTWIFMSRVSTKRSATMPLGDLSSATVVYANVMVSRVSLLMLLGWCKLCDQMQEQPMTSLIAAHPRQKQVASVLHWDCVVMAMGAYGAPTEKPTKLWITCTWLNSLKKKYIPEPGKTAPKLVTRDGSGGVTGIRGALKESQTYPVGFGVEVGRLYTQWREGGCSRPAVTFPDFIKSDDWVDAELYNVTQLCKVGQCHPWEV